MEMKEVDIPFKGRTITLRKGDWLQINGNGEDHLLGRRGDRAQIVAIKFYAAQFPQDNDVSYFDLMREIPNPNWGDLGGKVPFGKGLRVSQHDLVRWFIIRHGNLKITENFIFKKRNLKGMECKIIADFANGDVFVEMNTNVGGGSCDGLGKKGHCVIIKENLLAPKTVDKKKTVSRRRKR